MTDRTISNRNARRTGVNTLAGFGRPDGLGTLRRLPAEVRLLIFEFLLAEPNCRTGFEPSLGLTRHFPTEILRVSSQIEVEAGHAFRRTGNFFIRVSGCYGSIFNCLRAFGIAVNTNDSFGNSRVWLTIMFPYSTEECFLGLPADEGRANDSFNFDIHIRDLPRLVRLIRFMHLAIDRTELETPPHIQLVHLCVRFLDQGAPSGIIVSSADLGRVMWPFRRLLQPDIRLQVYLPGPFQPIPNPHWFYAHWRNTINREELVWEIVTLGLYVAHMADFLLRVDEYTLAFDRYEMLIRFLDGQFERPDLATFFHTEARAADCFAFLYIYSSDGLLVAHLLSVRPTFDSARPSADFINILIDRNYEDTPMRAFCFALVHASQGLAAFARQIIAETVEEYEEGSWRFSRSLHRACTEALLVLRAVDEQDGFTDDDEKLLWSLLPADRAIVIDDIPGVRWDMHDDVSD